jgi:hypothetical protein
MNITIENFGTGWCGLKMGISDAEIPVLIERLQELQQSRGHFHMRSAFIGDGGIGDVEVYWSESDKPQSLQIE